MLWNQRWEHDKNPEEMIAALATVAAEGVEFDIALCGENFRNEPDEFLVARAEFGTRLRHFGWAEEDDYNRLVADADVVLCTAFHEFFGIAVLEALACGAYGVLPNRLSYPELVYPESASDHLYDDHDALLTLLRRGPHRPLVGLTGGTVPLLGERLVRGGSAVRRTPHEPAMTTPPG